MGDKSGIEWLEGGASWNPLTGCSRCSPGCKNCYAERLAATRLANSPRYRGTARLAGDRGEPRWTGKILYHEDLLDRPERWRKPRRIFVNSMSDLFHPKVPVRFIAQVFNHMCAVPRHDFIVLTKRAERMYQVVGGFRECPEGWITHNGSAPEKAYMGNGVVVTGGAWPPPNVILGVSVENQKYADQRILHLIALKVILGGGIRIAVSYEPALGPVDWRRFLRPGAFSRCTQCGRTYNAGRPGPKACPSCKGLPAYQKPPAVDLLICGFESGPGARTGEPDWARTARDHALEAGTDFYFKQWGGTNKKAAGRLLDGKLHDGYPRRRA